MASFPSSSGLTVLAMIQSNEANDILWYPNLAIAYHMTPFESTFSYKLPYSGTSNVIVGIELSCPYVM